GRARGGRRRRREGEPGRSPPAQPRRRMPRRGLRRMRMSQAPDIKPEATKPVEAPRSGPLPFDPEGRGPSEFRRRGAVLRRLLALSDWGALLFVLGAITASSSSTDVGDLFWMVLFSPAWVIVVKLQGLYE